MLRAETICICIDDKYMSHQQIQVCFLQCLHE